MAVKQDLLSRLPLWYKLFLSNRCAANVISLFLFCLFSVSDSGSSQGLSQPSTQTTQYLRADTPNNATPVTSKTFYSIPGQDTNTKHQQQPHTLLYSSKTYESRHLGEIRFSFSLLPLAFTDLHSSPNVIIDCEWPHSLNWYHVNVINDTLPSAMCSCDLLKL